MLVEVTDTWRGSLLVSELRTMFRRGRTQAMLLALAAVPVLMAVAVRLSSAPQPGQGPPLLDRVTQNGMFIGVTSLIICVPFFVPLSLAVVAGDAVAGEASLGTLRYLLLAPGGRTRLLIVKFLAILAFLLAATFAVVISGAVIGAILFDVGPVPLLSGDAVSVPESLLRAALVAGYVSLSMVGLAAIGLFVSTLTEIPVGAMAATAILAIAAQILGSIPQFEPLYPWLFSYRWLAVGDLLRTPIAWDSVAENARLQGGYLLVFGTAAWARMSNRDVLS